ncbi:MAG: Maf family protein [Bacilli bacterium]|nr:Maf family protein [Bacilli bacterium]
MKIILGSASQRRKELLTLLGYDFVVEAVNVDEQINSYLNADDYVSQAAIKKGRAMAVHPNELIICADTIVVLESRILGKPHNLHEARKMISEISGKSHQVKTGVFLNFGDYQRVFVESTIVEIDDMTKGEIEAYIHTDEPYDKAGGYAIQGLFGKHVKKIHGDFYNVMGLPLNRLYQEIKKIENKYQLKFKSEI